MGKESKTNAMRKLDSLKISYEKYYFEVSEGMTGVDTANILNEDPDTVFKTLVTEAGSGNHYVFLVPVAKELDLKKAAAAVGEKSVSMLKSKELLGLTGYIHGGCSPIGMKKFFRTVIHSSAAEFDTIIFSGGKRGFQIRLSLSDLSKVISFELGDIIRE